MLQKGHLCDEKSVPCKKVLSYLYVLQIESHGYLGCDGLV